MAGRRSSRVVHTAPRVCTSVLSLFFQAARRLENAASEAFCEYVVECSELCMQSVSTVILHLRTPNVKQDISETAVLYSALLSELLECLRTIHRQWETHLDHFGHGAAHENASYRAPLVNSGHVGRPRFHVTQHQLQYLRSMSFTWVQISQKLSISMMTLYRRRQEYSVVGQPNGTLTDSELRSIIVRLQSG